MAIDLDTVLSGIDTKGNRSFDIVYPLTLEGELDHQVIAARRVINDIRGAGIKIEVGGTHVPRDERKALPVVVVSLAYTGGQNDGTVEDHLKQAILKFAARLALSETVAVMVCVSLRQRVPLNPSDLRI